MAMARASFVLVWETTKKWAERTVAAEALSNHRPHYLDYEGPVSGGRGFVARWDAGTFEWDRETDTEKTFHLRGAHLQGRARLSRTGNRQLNAALHRIAMTQARMHPPAQELLARLKLNGDGSMDALRVLKRRLSDVVYRAMLNDPSQPALTAA